MFCYVQDSRKEIQEDMQGTVLHDIFKYLDIYHALLSVVCKSRRRCCVWFDIPLPWVCRLRLGLVPVVNAALLLRKICQDLREGYRWLMQLELQNLKTPSSITLIWLLHISSSSFFLQHSILQQQMEMLWWMFVQECHSSLSSEITHLRHKNV